MAKNDNLHDFLVDVADAIREKKGTTDLINPQNFSEEILSIESGGGITETMVDNTGNGLNAIKNVIVEDGVQSIANNAFAYVLSLETIQLPDSILSIGETAFRGCTSLQPFAFPPQLTTISRFMLSGLIWEDVIIPEGITAINYGAFYNCTKLANCVLPDSLQTIGGYAFESCYSLTSIHLGPNVIYIDVGAFLNASKLLTVVIDAVVPPVIDQSSFGGNISGRLFYVPDESVDAYKSATNWSSYADSIKGISELPA